MDPRDKGNGPAPLWGEFSHDPRRADHAGLRASDRDRDVAHRAVADAYADGRLDREELDERTAQRRDARLGLLVWSLICLGIWLLTTPGGFFWPGFVILGTGVNLLQTVLRRDEIVDARVRKLERQQDKQQRKALRSRRPGGPGAGAAPGS